MPKFSLLDGGTTATTGGTAQNFGSIGKFVTNGNAYADEAVVDITAREEVILTSRAAALQPNGSWSKQRCKATVVIPYLSSDTQYFAVARVEVEVNPEHLANDSTLIDTLREKGAQLLVDSELDTFWDTGARP